MLNMPYTKEELFDALSNRMDILEAEIGVIKDELKLISEELDCVNEDIETLYSGCDEPPENTYDEDNPPKVGLTDNSYDYDKAGLL